MSISISIPISISIYLSLSIHIYIYIYIHTSISISISTSFDQSIYQSIFISPVIRHLGLGVCPIGAQASAEMAASLCEDHYNTSISISI